MENDNEVVNKTTTNTVLSAEEEKNKENAINLLKPIFERFNALSKENGMMNEEIIAEVNSEEFAKSFNLLKAYKIIKKASGKYYYVAENEKNTAKRKISQGAIVGIVIAVIAIIAMLYFITPMSTKVNTVSNEDISFSVGNSWISVGDYDSYYGWDFYRYINTVPETEDSSNTIDSESSSSYDNYPATINVYYETLSADDEISDANELQTMLQSYMEQLAPDEINSEVATNKAGYQTVIYKLVFNASDDVIGGVEYVCYVLNGNNITSITGVSYCLEDAEELKDGVKTIADSLEWAKQN